MQVPVRCFSKTWGHPQEIDSYRCVTSANRRMHWASGVAIYERGNESVLGAPDVEFTDAVRNSEGIVVASVYVLPGAQHSQIADFLIQTFVPEQDVPLIVMGDFNMNTKDPHNAWFTRCVQVDLGMPFASNTNGSSSITGSCLNFVFMNNKVPILLQCMSFAMSFPLSETACTSPITKHTLLF